MANEKRLIDANAWKSFYKELKDKLEVYNQYYDGYEDALDNVDDWMDAQPTVEVVHGRWETANDGTHFCPHCGCDAPYTWDDIDRSFINSADDVPDRPSNFCPNCGADMRGDSDA